MPDTEPAEPYDPCAKGCSNAPMGCTGPVCVKNPYRNEHRDEEEE